MTNEEYKTACNVLLSLEQIVRKSDGWEDSAVEAVHNAIQTAIKCMHKRSQGESIRIEDGMKKARSGNYVIYDVDFLLDNLAREVNIMESARRLKAGKGNDND